MSKSKYACVSAKVLAMRARKITEDDYQELIKAEGLKEVFLYLRDNTYYGDFLKTMNMEEIHRIEFEAHLADLKVQELEKLMHYLSGVDKMYFKTFLISLEIESLRILIRGVARNENLESLKKLLVYSYVYSSVPFEKLLHTRNWDEFKKALINTEYYRIFEIYKEIKPDQDLIMIERNLDRYLYDSIKKQLFKLNKKADRDLIKVQRKNFDLLNLIWIYRGKKFYKLSPEEMMAYSLRGGLKLGESELLRLVEAKGIDEMKEQLADTDYDFLLNHTKTIDLFMERRRRRYLYFMYQRLFREGNGSFDRVVAYVSLLDFEIEDITSIIESKRYGMGSDEIEKYLIRPI